jgi:hypothetical protein
MQQDVKQEVKKKKTQRYAISVSARTYDRLRSTVRGSLAGFVDEIVTSALADPAILARLLARCHRKDG